MSRYIDADALGIGKANRNAFTIPEYADGWNSAIEIIENAPTADVVEVVRCKDCKHHPDNGGECDRTITHTSRGYVCEVNTYRYIGLEYCSYGERREK